MDGRGWLVEKPLAPLKSPHYSEIYSESPLSDEPSLKKKIPLLSFAKVLPAARVRGERRGQGGEGTSRASVQGSAGVRSEGVRSGTPEAFQERALQQQYVF